MRAILALLLSLGAYAHGARVSITDSFLAEHQPMSGGLRIGLQSIVSTASRKHHKHSRDDDDDDDDTAYMAIRFIVPAHEADDFEDKWQGLQEHCEKKEKVEHMSLKKTAMDNVVYWSYGEWESMRDLHEHFESEHFEEFSDWVDEHDIRWEMKLLDNESKEIEEEQGKKLGDKKLRFHKDNTHILTHYYIPPGEAEGFVKAWTKAAEDTIDEKGNLLYSLRKIMTENTRYVAYGTWDRMSDWLDHHESKHLLKLHDYAADKDIVWWNEILEEVEDEDDDDDDDDDNKAKAKKSTKA